MTTCEIIWAFGGIVFGALLGFFLGIKTSNATADRSDLISMYIELRADYMSCYEKIAKQILETPPSNERENGFYLKSLPSHYKVLSNNGKALRISKKDIKSHIAFETKLSSLAKQRDKLIKNFYKILKTKVHTEEIVEKVSNGILIDFNTRNISLEILDLFDYDSIIRLVDGRFEKKQRVPIEYVQVSINASWSDFQNQSLKFAVQEDSDSVEADILTLLQNTLDELRKHSDTKTYLKNRETTYSSYHQTLDQLDKKIKRPYNFFDIIHW